MKKQISILLLAAMLLALAACGNAAPSSDVASSLEKVKEAVPAEKAAPAEEAAPVQEEAPAQEEAAPAEESPDASEMIGEKDGNSYANKVVGIRAVFPDTWTILDNEQTAQITGVVADNFSDTALADQLRESGSLYDLYAMTLDGSGENVNVVIQDLGVLYGIVIDEERYLSLAEDQLATALGQMGMEDVKLDKQSFAFAGQDRFSVLISASYSGVPVYERMVLIKSGNYMSAITAFSLDQARLDGIFDLFEAY